MISILWTTDWRDKHPTRYLVKKLAKLIVNKMTKYSSLQLQLAYQIFLR